MKFDNFSEMSNTIKIQSIRDIEKKNVPINLLSIYLSSILSIMALPSTPLRLTNLIYKRCANCLTILFFQS